MWKLNTLTRVDVKGGHMDIKGSRVDVKGNHVDIKGTLPPLPPSQLSSAVPLPPPH